MNDLSALDQSHWLAPASLLIELAFLIAGVWFARNILKTMRAFQEQIGALLKLSITGAAADRSLSGAAAAPSLAEANPYWLAPSESTAPNSLQPTETGAGRIALARRKMVLWLQAPMTNSQTAPWRRIITWLQAPAGN